MGESAAQGPRDRLRLTAGALGALALHAALVWWFPRVESPAPAARFAGPTMHVRLARRAPEVGASAAETPPAPVAAPEPPAPAAVPPPPSKIVEPVVAPSPKPVAQPAEKPVSKPAEKPVEKPVAKAKPRPAPVSEPEPVATPAPAVAPGPAEAVHEAPPVAAIEPGAKARAAPAAALGAELGEEAASDAGPHVEAPTYEDNPRPDYPRIARRRGQEGTVILRVYVEPTGRPKSVEVRRSSGHAVLDAAAVDAVRAWRFRPGRRDGRVEGAWVEVPVRFSLEDV